MVPVFGRSLFDETSVCILCEGLRPRTTMERPFELISQGTMHRGSDNPHTVERCTSTIAEKHFCRDPRECEACPYYLGSGFIGGIGGWGGGGVGYYPSYPGWHRGTVASGGQNSAPTVPPRCQRKIGSLAMTSWRIKSTFLDFPEKKKILIPHGASTKKNDP